MLHYSCIKKKKICSKIKFHPLETLNIIVIFLLLLRTSEEILVIMKLNFRLTSFTLLLVPIQYQKFYGSCIHGSIKKQFFFFPKRLVLFLILTFISLFYFSSSEAQKDVFKGAELKIFLLPIPICLQLLEIFLSTFIENEGDAQAVFMRVEVLFFHLTLLKKDMRMKIKVEGRRNI